MSESGESQPSNTSLEYCDADALCVKIHRKIVGGGAKSPLAVASHTSAVNAMLAVRDCLLRGNTVTKTGRLALLCAGTAVLRRRVHAVDDADQIGLLATTQTLLFSLLVLLEPPPQAKPTGDEAFNESAAAECDMDVSDEVDENAALLAAWEGASALDCMTQNDSSSWAALLRSDAAVSRAALVEGARMKNESTMADMMRLSDCFFRCSANAMVNSFLESATPAGDGFMTLDTASVLDMANRSQTLEAIVGAAESEAGQAVLRDLVVSFRMPKSAVGVRRSIAMSREASNEATKRFPEILNVAHETAVRGAEWTYGEDKDELHRTCALLAGFALTVTRSKDALRKQSAFGGLVSLPFLDTPPPPHGADKRIALIENANEWIVFALSSNKPKVHFRGRGLDGLETAILHISRRKTSRAAL